MKPNSGCSPAAVAAAPARLAAMLSRRDFLAGPALAALAALVPGCQTTNGAGPGSGLIDCHQHVGYLGRTDDALVAHQRALGARRTILLPAGRDALTRGTVHGRGNGLEARARGNKACYRLHRAFPKTFLFGANEVPDLPDAVREIETWLKRGAVLIGEQKFGLECDAPEMQRIYALARDYNVPVLLHWQFGRYNHGFARFHRMLEKFPDVRFISHAQTWWAHMDAAYVDSEKNLYPKGRVTPGGLTDRYLSDYPNAFGDLSAGSGLNALTRDPEFARDFLRRHQDKLLFGSDCPDAAGAGAHCLGAKILAAIRGLADPPQIQRKILCDNARRLFRI